MNSKMGRPIVLAAASGAGKSTLAARLLKQVDNLQLSVSYTTRAPRGAEQDGVEYHFIDETTFKKMIAKGEFIEWALVHGHYYGSGLQMTQKRLEQGSDLLFDIDVQGAEQIKNSFSQAILIWIDAPNWNELERRLRGRGTDSDRVIEQRLINARGEQERAKKSFDHFVINDELTQATNKLVDIIK